MNDKPQWSFRQEQTADPAPMAAPADVATVTWTASEFVEHDKSAGWYLSLIGVAALAAVAIYFLTHDVITVALVVIAAIAFGIMGARKPRTLEYKVDGSGVTVGPKFYPYNNFKSFALIQEGPLNSVWFMPLKRFMPILTVYLAPDDAEKIIDTVSSFLPVQEHQPDPVDRLIHRLRF